MGRAVSFSITAYATLQQERERSRSSLRPRKSPEIHPAFRDIDVREYSAECLGNPRKTSTHFR